MQRASIRVTLTGKQQVHILCVQTSEEFVLGHRIITGSYFTGGWGRITLNSIVSTLYMVAVP
jgi:hypothetical protein